jgi:hypothetical protein
LPSPHSKVPDPRCLRMCLRMLLVDCWAPVKDSICPLHLLLPDAQFHKPE